MNVITIMKHAVIGLVVTNVGRVLLRHLPHLFRLVIGKCRKCLPYYSMCVCALCVLCVCVCVFIKLHIAAQSGPVILIIICHSH